MKKPIGPAAKRWHDHFAACMACRARIDALCEEGRVLLKAALVEGDGR